LQPLRGSLTRVRSIVKSIAKSIARSIAGSIDHCGHFKMDNAPPNVVQGERTRECISQVSQGGGAAGFGMT
jgi:hypothetical protein